jgi:hypothetical protein
MATNLLRTAGQARRRAECGQYSAPARSREVMSYVSRLKLLAASGLTLDNTSLQPTRVSNRRRRREYTVAGTL